MDELHASSMTTLFRKGQVFLTNYLFSCPHMENCNTGTLLCCVHVQIHTHGSRLRELMRCRVIDIMTGLDRASFPSDTWQGLWGDLGARLSCQRESLNSNCLEKWTLLEGSVAFGWSPAPLPPWAVFIFLFARLLMTSLRPSEKGVCCPGRCVCILLTLLTVALKAQFIPWLDKEESLPCILSLLWAWECISDISVDMEWHVDIT